MKEKLRNIATIMEVPLKYARGSAILLLCLEIAYAFAPSISVLATSAFIERILLLLKSQSTIGDIIPYAAIVIATTAFSTTSPEIIQFLTNKIQFKLRQNYRPILVDKRCSLKYSYIENDEAWDIITRISTDTEKKCSEAYDMLIFLFRMIISVVSLLTIIATSSFIAALLIIAISVPLFIIAAKLGNKLYDAEKEATKYERRYKYLNEVLTSREQAGERTLFEFSKDLNEKWQAQFKKGTGIRVKADLFATNVNFVTGAITVVLTTIILVILIFLVKSGAIAIGLCVALTSALYNIIQTITWELSYTTQEISKGAEFYKDMNSFFEMAGQNGALEMPSDTRFIFDKLEFKNVSFKYPETDRYILKNISFTIEKNKHYALVGVNGCGKTTISKLISGLYDNYEGQILVNGKELKEYTQPEIKAICSIVYQDFAKYNISLKDNILLGNVNIQNQDEQTYKFSEAVSTIKLSNVIDNLKNKADTLLGKLKEDGVDLSGGEWQRVAIARNIINSCPLKILDEPTAALDPISESQIYEEFEKISHNDTTIFISHRLGSTKLANKIFVINDGQVCETGSHDELMKLNGIYAGMFNSQRSWYQ